MWVDCKCVRASNVRLWQRNLYASDAGGQLFLDDSQMDGMLVVCKVALFVGEVDGDRHIRISSSFQACTREDAALEVISSWIFAVAKCGECSSSSLTWNVFFLTHPSQHSHTNWPLHNPSSWHLWQKWGNLFLPKSPLTLKERMETWGAISWPSLTNVSTSSGTASFFSTFINTMCLKAISFLPLLSPDPSLQRRHSSKDQKHHPPGANNTENYKTEVRNLKKLNNNRQTVKVLYVPTTQSRRIFFVNFLLLYLRMKAGGWDCHGIKNAYSGLGAQVNYARNNNY